MSAELCQTCGGKGRVKTAIGNWTYCSTCGGRGTVESDRHLVSTVRVPVRHRGDYCRTCGMSEGRHWTGCREADAS